MSVAVNNAAAGVITSNVQIAACSNVAFGIPPGGTIATAGTVLLGAALDYAYGTSPNGLGAWMYYPANAVSGDAVGGFYWTVFTDTTHGTVYAGKYSGVGAPGIGSTATQVTGSNSAYTQSTSLQYAGVYQIPANAMGPNGQIRVTGFCGVTSNANGKTLTISISASSSMSSPATLSGVSAASALAYRLQTAIGNTGSTQFQSTCWANNGFGTQAQEQQKAFDSTQPLYIGFGLTVATPATDYAIWQQQLIEVIQA